MPRRSSVSLWIACFVGPFVFHSVDAAAQTTGASSCLLLLTQGSATGSSARTAFVTEATDRRFATDGSRARWMVPITLGIELR